MEIIFLNTFRKRENSTKRPPEDLPRTRVNGYLREPCSIMNPVFAIEPLPGRANPNGFTYAIITQFRRSYFVRDWQWVDGVWQCSLEVDVLASFQTDIGLSSAYVERAASASNGVIVDNFYPTTAVSGTVNIPIATSWYGVTADQGCYVLGILCNTNRATSQIGGAVTYYVMTPEQMGNLMGYLLSGDFLDDNGYTQRISDPSQQIMRDTAKALVNPLQYIASCMWFPVPANDLGDHSTHRIVLGYFDLDSNECYGQYLSAASIVLPATCTLPDHPQSATRGDFLNFSPYTRLTLNIPPFGSMALDTSYRYERPYVLCRVWIDPITGKATMRITMHQYEDHHDVTPIVREATSMMGVPIQLAQMGPDYINLIGNALQVATSLDAGWRGDIGEGTAITRSFNAIGNGLNSLMPQVETQGVSGSFLSTVMPANLTVQWFAVINDDNVEFGRPLCEIRTINTLQGYIKCEDAHVDFACFADEKAKILRYMTGGFFWE